MSATEAELAAQLLYPLHITQNANALYNVKFLSSCFIGAVCGVLGLENFQGFGLFCVSILLSSAVIYGVQCRGRPEKYVQGGWWELVSPGQENVFSFILLWTLFYGE
jgi:ER membrane protein complex subunit 6